MNAGASGGRVVDDVVLEVEDLVMHFGPVRAVDGVSFRLRRGQVMALVGESGSGKSTVGRCIVRLLEPTAGAVLLGGTDVTPLSRARLPGPRRDVSIALPAPPGSLHPRPHAPACRPPGPVAVGSAKTSPSPAQTPRPGWGYC